MSSVIIARFGSDIWKSSLELLADCEITKLSEKINFFPVAFYVIGQCL